MRRRVGRERVVWWQRERRQMTATRRPTMA
jgi:hypothetical protein